MSKYKAIWLHPDNKQVVQIIDQRFLPHKYVVEDLKTFEDAFICIKDMHTRGAGSIGVAAAFAVYLAMVDVKINRRDYDYFFKCCSDLKQARPTAINLNWAVDMMLPSFSLNYSVEENLESLLQKALQLASEELDVSFKIGISGLPLMENIYKEKGIVNVLTHCNAGWLAYQNYGTALAPIYLAHEKGIKVHVWVDETRPRLQGAALTAWELLQDNIPHTLIPDNTGGHLMQQGLVDLVIVGTDRTTLNGDVTNKIGTYLKALAAFDNHVPFYAAVPSASIDWASENGLRDVPIETRDEDEVRYVSGLDEKDSLTKVLILPKGTKTLNYGFDVTPSRLVSGLITERGICKAEKKAILNLFPEYADK